MLKDAMVPDTRNHTAAKSPALDIQESLKILQFRFGRTVGFRPVVVRRGVRYFPVDGKLRPESEIVRWTGTSQPE